MSMMRFVALGLVAAGVHSPAHADPEAHDRLMKAAEVIRQAQSLTYYVEYEMESSMFSLPKIEMQVSMRRRASGGWDVRREGRSSGVIERAFATIMNPSTCQWIDYEDKTIYERYTRQASNNQPFSLANTGWVMTLGENEPYKKDLDAPESRVEGTVELDGVLCEIVYVDEGENKQKRRWYFGVADHLPRKLETIMSGEGFKSTGRHTLRDVTINEELPDDLFNFETPPGFKEQRLPKPVVGGDPISPNLTPNVAQPQETPVARRPAPEFDLPNHKQQKVNKETLKDKIAVLVFGGTWWSQWPEALVQVQSLQEQFKDKNVVFVAMSVKQRNPQDAIDLFTEKKFTFHLVTGADDVARLFNVRSYPTFVIVNHAWWISDEVKGFSMENNATVNELVQKIEAALADPTGTGPAVPPQGPDAAHDPSTTIEGGETRTRTGGGG